jgi:biotin carboxyl carrier protein
VFRHPSASGAVARQAAAPGNAAAGRQKLEKTRVDPMSTEVRIPKLGMSMTEGILAEWLVSDRAAVNKGDVIYTLESDKSSQEIEAPASGVIRISGAVGETYEVGALIANIE